MKPKDAESFLEFVREATIFDILLVSILLLPLYLGAWLVILDSVLSIGTEQKVWVLVVLFALYVVGIVLMKVGAGKEDKRRRAGIRIRNYLVGRGNTAISFERIRNVIDSSYSDDFLESVIDLFPDDLRLARIKGGKRGVGLLIEKEEEE